MTTAADALLPLLACPLCHLPLHVPVTLLCGHTLCSRHVLRHDDDGGDGDASSPARRRLALAPCPLPDCDRPSEDAAPNIPSTSRVTFIPAQASAADSAPAPFARVDDLRTDVTVSKLAHVIRSRARTSPSSPSHFAADDADGSDDDGGHGGGDGDGGDRPPPLSSSSASLPPRLCPPRSQSPSDRHSRHRSHLSDDDSDGDGDGDDPGRRARPRKRRRRRLSLSPSPQTRTAAVAQDADDASPDSAFLKELTAELTCEICLLLFYRPLTTPCQHTFCSKCLQRSLDHSDQCPLCRHSLAGFASLHLHAQPCNKLVLSILLKALPDAYAERGRVLDEEEHDARLDTPVFVSQLSFPGMPTLLHVYEPRYRLMLRRVLEAPAPRFGMLMPPRPTAHGAGNDYGTMLDVRSVRMLPDGRSIVETWGAFRFRVMERGTLDGYMVARVERIDDFPDELDVDEVSIAVPIPALDDPIARARAHAFAATNTGTNIVVPALVRSPARSGNPDELLAICHAFLGQLRQGAAPWLVQRLDHHYGPMPANASHFSFWMAMLLPIDEYEKAKLFPIVSPRLRLRLIVYWIERLNSNWWFTSGCVIS